MGSKIFLLPEGNLILLKLLIWAPSYGFKLKGGFIDDEGNTVLEWNNMPFARVDIAIHTYLE